MLYLQDTKMLIYFSLLLQSIGSVLVVECLNAACFSLLSSSHSPFIHSFMLTQLSMMLSPQTLAINLCCPIALAFDNLFWHHDDDR
jgi:hypothetical protein